MSSTSPVLSRRLVWLMAIACGVSVANAYYNTPLLGTFSTYFGAPHWEAGLAATAAQVGYGLGILFCVPLGDLMERRSLTVGLVGVCAVCLLGLAAAPTLPVLIAVQFLVAFTCISPQILIPLAVEMAPPEQRGKIVGTLMSGLLAGVLLARTVAGIVTDHFGWRVLYLAAAASMVLLGFCLQRALPRRPATLHVPYRQLMGSLLELLRTQPVLRHASWVSALSFAAFTAFWATMSFLLEDRFHQGATAAGLFGIVGLAGAAGAPLAGWLADRRGARYTNTLALGCVGTAFLVMGGWVAIPGLVLGVFLMDLGVQSIQVAAQSSVISLVPEARSRLNTIYMVTRFAGGAAGSALGVLAWTWASWAGVCTLCISLSAIALAVHLRPPQAAAPSPALRAREDEPAGAVLPEAD